MFPEIFALISQTCSPMQHPYEIRFADKAQVNNNFTDKNIVDWRT